MQLQLELLILVFSYLDHRTVSQRALRVSRKWRNAALLAVPPAVTRYFQRHWTQEPVELALPSNILAMSASADESSIYIFARGTVQEDDEAVLYVHCRRSGQRYFAGLPAVYSRAEIASSGIAFCGPNWLTLRLADGGLHIFDCEKGVELVLPEGASDFVVSDCGRYAALVSEEYISVGLARSEPLQLRSPRHHLRQRSRHFSAEDDFGMSGPGGYLTKWGGVTNPSSPVSPRANQRREVYRIRVDPAGELRVPRHKIGESLDADLYVHRRMLVTTLSRRESVVFSCFRPATDLEYSDDEDTSYVEEDWSGAQQRGSRRNDNGEDGSEQVGVSAALSHTSLKLQGVSLQVAQLQVTGRASATLVGIGVSVHVVLLFWNPFTNVLRETTLHSPYLQPLRSRSRYEQLCEIVSGQVLSFTSWSDSPKGDFSLHFVSVDGSLMSTIPLKGPSMWLPMPKSGQGVVCLKTSDTYRDDAPHPLLEATEYGMGTLLTFLTAGQVSVQAQRARAEGNRLLRRILCVTSVSVVLIGLSFVIAVGTLLYNGWWLHMQLLFTTPV